MIEPEQAVATIAVEMPTASASPSLADALLRACTIAAAPDRCEAADSASEAPIAYAVVTWHGDLAVLVEIGRPGDADWLERKMTFVPEDPPIERWQAVGFAIGTLFGAAREQVPEEKSSPPASVRDESHEAQTETAARKRPPPARAHHTVQLAGLGRVGTGTESSARFGGGLALSARHAAGPFALADVNFDMAEVAIDDPEAAVSVRFVSVGLAVGTVLPLSRRLHLDLSAGPIIEYQWLWTDVATAAESRPIGGVRANVSLAHRLGSRGWLGLGAQIGSRFGDSTIAIDGQRVESIPLIFGTLNLSLGYELWRSQRSIVGH
jgi:hypothetical protein